METEPVTVATGLAAAAGLAAPALVAWYWRDTVGGLVPLTVVAAVVMLLLTSEPWRRWAARHRTADYLLAAWAIGWIGAAGAADLRPWSAVRVLALGAAALGVAVLVAAWRRLTRRRARG